MELSALAGFSGPSYKQIQYCLSSNHLKKHNHSKLPQISFSKVMSMFHCPIHEIYFDLVTQYSKNALFGNTK